MTIESDTSDPQREISSDPESVNFKLLFLGEAGVGKTSLARRIVDNKFHTDEKTTAVDDLYSCVLDADVGRVNVFICDKTKKESTLQHDSHYFYGADAIVLIYDSTNLSSFRKLTDWIHSVKRVRETYRSQMFIVGTKYDLEGKRVVHPHNLYELSKYRIPMFETSALTGSGVEETFMKIMVRVMKPTKMKPIGRVTVEQTQLEVFKTSEDESTPCSSSSVDILIQETDLPWSNVAEQVERLHSSTSAADSNEEQEQVPLSTVSDPLAESLSVVSEDEGQGKLSPNRDDDTQEAVPNLEETPAEGEKLQSITSSSVCVTDTKAEYGKSSKLEKDLEEPGLSKCAEVSEMTEEDEAPKSSSAEIADDQLSLSSSSSVNTVTYVTAAPQSNGTQQVEQMLSSTSAPDGKIEREEVSLSDVNKQLDESSPVVSDKEEQYKSSSNVKNEEDEVVSLEHASKEGAILEPTTSSSIDITDTKPETSSSSKQEKSETEPGLSKTASDVCEEPASTSLPATKLEINRETGEEHLVKEKEKEAPVPETLRPNEKVVKSKPSVAARAARGRGSRSTRDPRKLEK